VRSLSCAQITLNSDGLIAQALHQHHQMGRRFNEFLVKTRAKPFTDFLVDRRAVEAADLNFTLGCGTTTMVRNRSAGTTLIAKLALLGAILRYHTSINGIPVDAQMRTLVRPNRVKFPLRSAVAVVYLFLVSWRVRA
jgi:hypothetical protein